MFIVPAWSVWCTQVQSHYVVCYHICGATVRIRVCDLLHHFTV